MKVRTGNEKEAEGLTRKEQFHHQKQQQTYHRRYRKVKDTGRLFVRKSSGRRRELLIEKGGKKDGEEKNCSLR